MTVCFAVLYHAAGGRDPEAYLESVPLHRHLPLEFLILILAREPSIL